MKLNSAQIAIALESLDGWSQNGDAICKQYQFAGFVHALNFVNRVAKLAEEADHHPDIDIRYSKVLLTLATHSEGGVTEKDMALARSIDEE